MSATIVSSLLAARPKDDPGMKSGSTSILSKLENTFCWSALSADTFCYLTAVTCLLENISSLLAAWPKDDLDMKLGSTRIHL